MRPRDGGARVRAYGDRALLVDTAEPLTLAAALAGRAGVVDVVPGAASVLVVAASPALAASLTAVLLEASHDPAAGGRGDGGAGAVLPAPVAEPPAADPPVVQLPVVYDGPDLEEVGQLTGLGAEGVRHRHAAGSYTVAFVGFTPGFGYLSGLDPALEVPRRDDPRPSVPAGAVAVGGPWTGVYPRATPGGWRLVGRTEAALWSLERDPPALLSPGVRVRFVDVTP